MVYNFMQGEKGKTLTPEQMYPLDSDKKEEEQPKYEMPFSAFKKLFYTIYADKVVHE